MFLIHPLSPPPPPPPHPSPPPGCAAPLTAFHFLAVQLIAINDINLAGAPFDAAMDAMIGLQGPDVEFTFFRGTQEELKNASGGCIHVLCACLPFSY